MIAFFLYYFWPDSFFHLKKSCLRPTLMKKLIKSIQFENLINYLLT